MKSENIPTIRFPEYTDEWRNHKLGDLYSERNEKGNDELQILSVSIHSGVSDGELDEEDLGKVVRRSEDKSKYKRVYEGDLIFNMMRAWQGAIGVAKSDGMISPAYISAIPNEEDVFPLFMDYALRRKQAIEEINRLSYGVTDFRKRLYWNSFVRVNCMLPSTEEQQKIYCFLRKIDNLIILLERKCDKLREYKRGCLQKMFPRDDSDVPEIRFPGFTDAWEQRKLGEVTDSIKNGYTYKSDGSRDRKYKITRIESISSGSINVEKLGSSDEINESFLLKDGDILFSHINSLQYIANTALYTADLGEIYHGMNLLNIRSNQKIIDAHFLIHLLKHDKSREWFRIAAKPAVNQASISTTDVAKFEFMMPNIIEQKRIATLLDNFENLITLHQRKCDKYKELKNSLLQQMFV